MSSSQEPYPSSHPGPTLDLEPGVRAARKRTGLTQLEVADRLGVSLDTYRRWDRGTTKPRDPEKQQLLARVLATPHEVLFPADANPQVAQAMRLLDAEEAAAAEAAVLQDPGPGDDLWSQPVEAREAGESPKMPPRPAAVLGCAPSADSSMPDPLEVLRTIDGVGTRRPDSPRGARRWSRHPGRVAAGAATILVAVVAAVAVATGSPDGATPPQTAPRVQTAEAAAEQRRVETADAMVAAAGRQDYDLAIELAGRLGDRPAAMRWKRSAATLLVSRAARAVERGDLDLAEERLAKARSRYSTAPGSAAVERRIAAIERRRRQRAAARRRADARRAAAVRRPQSSRGNATADPTSDAPGPASPQPDPVAPTPVPNPVPAPSPTGGSSGGSSGGSKGGESGGSGGASSNETIDPGLF